MKYKVDIDLNTPSHFRFDDSIHRSDRIQINKTEFFTIRETDCYFYVVEKSLAERIVETKGLILNNNLFKGGIRKVGKNAYKSYCHRDVNAALDAFFKRKEKQLFYASFNQSRSSQILKLRDQIINGAENIPTDEFIQCNVRFY